MTQPQTYTVGQVARLAAVTVRTLHHYDEIGLLPPSGRDEQEPGLAQYVHDAIVALYE